MERNKKRIGQKVSTEVFLKCIRHNLILLNSWVLIIKELSINIWRVNVQTCDVKVTMLSVGYRSKSSDIEKTQWSLVVWPGKALE